MNGVLRWIRRVLIWVGPILVLMAAVSCGFLYWSLATEPGTRWILQSAAQQTGGRAEGIEGSLWSGVRVRDLSIERSDMAIEAQNLYLQAHWRELLDQRLHIADLSADRLKVSLATAPEESADAVTEPFRMPALPVTVAIDRLAVNELHVYRDGEPLPVGVRELVASVALAEPGAQLVLKSLELSHESVRASASGEVLLHDLADPWPLQARLAGHVVSVGPDSPLCVRRYVPTRDADTAKSEVDCQFEYKSTIEGSLEQFKVVLAGTGQDISLDADATVLPRAAFPFKNAVLDLRLADGSSLRGNVDWDSTVVEGAIHDRLVGSVQSEKLNVGALAGAAIPPAVLTSSIRFDAELRDHTHLISADLDASFGSGSMWNKQPLSGGVKTRVINNARAHPEPDLIAQFATLQIAAMNMDLRLGPNHLRAEGALGAGDSRLNLNLLAPQLAAFWPQLSGGARLQGHIGGSLASHAADLKGGYTPANSKPDQFAVAPTEAHLALTGGWGKGTSAEEKTDGWHGRLSTLQIQRMGFNVRSRTPVALSIVPDAVAPAWQWQVGAATVDVAMPSSSAIVIAHKGSRGGAGRWQTQGSIDRIVVKRDLIQQLQKDFGLDDPENGNRGTVKIKATKTKGASEIVLGADWNLRFAGVLEGEAHIRRLSGDLMVPGEPPFPLGLQTLSVDLNARPVGSSSSRLSADVNIVTAKMGRMTARGTALLSVSADGAFSLSKKEPQTLIVDAAIDDLGWTSLFLGDAVELGGALKANVQARTGPDGTWAATGTVTGQKIRLINIDNGVRLLDGTLAAHLDNDRFVLDSLRFPARLRVTPKEWRTNEWITTNPAAKNGYLSFSGAWNLTDSVGKIGIDLYRYPVLQRSDRYAMVTGKLTVDAQLPRIAIAGKVVADAGWFDLDMLGGIPTVDSDVVVIRPGEEKKVNVPAEISLDLDVDLGPRFYLTGYGVNSGLVGGIHIMMVNGKLTAEGALRTRGGAIEVYGQRLQLRRGTITFQGDITSPVLNIEALRTGVAVQAGVRVAGTARRPRIDLVSYPDVNDVEKLSWLLLGRGADNGGGDAALLFSVGTSLLGSGAPFYRQFGLDEVSVRSGALGSTGSILPVESVVSGLDSGTSDIERKFVVASKKLASGITLSIEQALSDTGTVARASYRLARGLTAEISAGTVSGIALVYRTFFDD